MALSPTSARFLFLTRIEVSEASEETVALVLLVRNEAPSEEE